MTPTDEILEQATDWHLRLQEEPQCRAQFQIWLQTCPEHQRAWARIQAVWGVLGELAVDPAPEGRNPGAPAPAPASAGVRQASLLPTAAVDPAAAPYEHERRSPITPAPHAPEPAPQQALQPAGRPGRGRRRRAGIAAAAALAAIAVLIAPQAELALRADYRTGAGETRAVHLADGSTITLGPQSALSVSGSDPRHVTLLGGRAFFEVAPDPRHPFIAGAGQLSVRVLGTAFDIDLQPDSAEVALEHGQVQAESDQLPLSERLLPGERLKLAWPSNTVERSQIAPSQVGAWRTGSLFVEDQTVASIVAQLQRYTGGWIVIADPSLKHKRITGLFDLADPERALAALAQSLSVKSHKMTPWLHTLGNF